MLFQLRYWFRRVLLPSILSDHGSSDSIPHIGQPNEVMVQRLKLARSSLSVSRYPFARALLFSFSLEQGEPCPDGYTCICYPCELLPKFEFSFGLQASGGEPVGVGLCEEMATCASGILAFSDLNLLVVDNWGPAREVQYIVRVEGSAS